MGKTCFFIGHHDAPPAIRELLDVAVERHIKKYGVTRFIVGHYGTFDSMAAAAVTRMKMKYEGVELLLLLPYHPTERPIQPEKGLTPLFIRRVWKRCRGVMLFHGQTNMSYAIFATT